MAGTKEQGKGQVSAKRTGVPRPSARQKKYSKLLPVLGISKKAKLQLSGYSSNNTPAEIESRHTFQPLRDRLEEAAKACRLSPKHTFKVLKRVMDDTSDNRAAVSAVKTLHESVGWIAPQQVQVQSTHAIGVFVQQMRDQNVSLLELLQSIRQGQDKAVKVA